MILSLMKTSPTTWKIAVTTISGRLQAQFPFHARASSTVLSVGCAEDSQSGLPAVGRPVHKPESGARRGPRSPCAPVPAGVGVGLGRHLLFIREILLQLIRFVLVISLLC